MLTSLGTICAILFIYILLIRIHETVGLIPFLMACGWLAAYLLIISFMILCMMGMMDHHIVQIGACIMSPLWIGGTIYVIYCMIRKAWTARDALLRLLRSLKRASVWTLKCLCVPVVLYVLLYNDPCNNFLWKAFFCTLVPGFLVWAIRLPKVVYIDRAGRPTAGKSSSVRTPKKAQSLADYYLGESKK